MIIQLLLWALLAIIIIIGSWFVLTTIYDRELYGQTAPPPVTPTPVPTPTPTSPNPNLQYLPQKAYVQAYAPENGIPSTSGALQVVPTVVPQAAPQSSGIGIPTDIMGILGMLGGAAAYVKGHLSGKKAEKAEDTAKEAIGAEVQTKHAVKELARVTYDKMPDGGESIKDAPAVKLETLDNDTKQLADKAAKA